MSTDERKIPKIVLKIGTKHESTAPQEIEHFDSIYSTKIAEISNAFFKTEALGYGYNSISLSSLMKKVNQNAYRSLENVLELMGRMNDIEKKKTLFQVLSRLRDLYLKLQVIFEWTKVSNEHLALKTINYNVKVAKDNLKRLVLGLNFNSGLVLSNKHSEPNFKAYKHLLCSSEIVPSYFAPSIDALAPSKTKDLTDSEKTLWLSTLESLLRTEISKNIVNIPKNDYKLISINNGKVKILFLNIFEFEFTLVPEAESLKSAWFILGVQVGSMKEIFKNSLTGIFQFKYNNKNTTDSEYFKNIISDCLKYIELFYYEKMFSQFSFLSNRSGKSICLFQKSPNGSWFSLKPWFAKEEIIIVSFSNDSGFKVEGDVEDIKNIFNPSLSFDDAEANSIFLRLFESIFIRKLEVFLMEQENKGTFSKFILLKESFAELELFENFKLKISINPFSKVFNFDLIEFDEGDSDIIKFDHLQDKLENALINFDSELFNECIGEIRKSIFANIIAKRYNFDFSIVNCPEISPKTGICIQLRDEPTVAFSMNLDTKLNTLNIQFWSVSVSFLNGFVEIKFKEIPFANSDKTDFPKKIDDLLELLQKQRSTILEISSKFSFENTLKSFGIEGELENEKSFKVLSIGLPTCVSAVILESEGNQICGKLEFSNLVALKRKELIFAPVNSKNLSLLLQKLKMSIRLFCIWEHFNSLIEEGAPVVEIGSYEPITLKIMKNITLMLNNEGTLFGKVGDKHAAHLEEVLNADNFDIFSFIDIVNGKDSNITTRNNNEESPDLTWLSDSFM